MGPDRHDADSGLGCAYPAVDANAQGVRKEPEHKRAHQSGHPSIVSSDQGAHFTSS